MSNRKLQITLFAAIAAIGLIIAPGTAAAGPTSATQPGGAIKGDSGGAKPSNNQAGKPDNADKTDKAEKDDKDDDKYDKWEKWKRQAQDRWWQYKKQYEARTSSSSSKPAPKAYQKPAQAAYQKPASTNTAPTYAAAKPAASSTSGPCTCLTKEYTGGGTVVFKDLCTKEVAVYSKDNEGN